MILRNSHTRKPRGGSTQWLGESPSAKALRGAFFGAGGQIKVFTGVAFQIKPVKFWTGSAWVQKPIKRWSGSAWI